ncbi:oligosaccharide flippase family protein [Bacteroides cellulosilyticus]|uniref:oligosaccharide flippase family protein n=1 Tax=Bacteroides cellulosilyticus TaxID=246787 RepID=UPI0032C1B924
MKNKFVNKQGFFRNISILTTCNLFVNIVNLFTNMYLARILRPEGYGRYGVIITLSGILMTISSLGIRQVAIRRISQQQGSSWKQYKISITARLTGYIAVAILYFVYSILYQNQTFFFFIVVISNTLLLTIWDGIQNVAFGMQRMEYTGYINIISSIIILFIYIVLPIGWVSVLGVLVIQIIISSFKNICYYGKCKSEHLFTYSDNTPVSKVAVIDMIKESFPFYLLAVLTLFSTQWPVIFLANHSGIVEVAYFNTANKLMVPASVMLTTIMSALLPNLAKEYIYDYERFISKINAIFKVLVILGIFCCISLTLFRDELVYLIYGNEYKNTGNVMLTQCWYLVFHSVFALFGNVLTVVRKERIIVILSLLYAIINTAIFWPASYYGATVLSYGIILGCIINMSYHYYFLRKSVSGFVGNAHFFLLFGLIILGICISLCLTSSIYIWARIALWITLVGSMCIFRKYLLAYVNYKRT